MTEAAKSFLPQSSYGVLRRDSSDGSATRAIEQIRRSGYAIVDSGFAPSFVEKLATLFSDAHDGYLCRYDLQRLRSLDEHNTIRALLSEGPREFLDLASHAGVLAVVGGLIEGRFVLNQQNGLVNPPSASYSQAAWHRDLPYQHFVADRPLAVNALYCVDDFTHVNGATWVIPGSHRFGAFPSDEYLADHAVQVEAAAGQFIVLDCMMFHSGGSNRSSSVRRAVNHVYAIPHIAQQITWAHCLPADGLNEDAKKLLGFDLVQARSVDDYLQNRVRTTNAARSVAGEPQ